MSVEDTQDLEKMIPTQPVTLIIDGKTVVVRNMKVKQLSTVLKEIHPFVGAFSTGVESIDLVKVIGDHTDNVIRLASTLSGEPEDWIADLEVDKLVLILTTIIEVNLSFFTLQVFPSLSQAMGRLSVVAGNKAPALG